MRYNVIDVDLAYVISKFLRTSTITAPVPHQIMDKRLYFVMVEDQKRGPYGFDALQAEIKDGRIRLSDLGSCEGLSDWKPLRILLGESPKTAEAPPIQVAPLQDPPTPTRGKTLERQNTVRVNLSQTEAQAPTPKTPSTPAVTSKSTGGMSGIVAAVGIGVFIFVKWVFPWLRDHYLK